MAKPKRLDRYFFGRDRKDLVEVVVRPRDDVHADQLADASRRRRAGIGGRLHRSDVAAHDGRHQPGIDLLPADEHDVGGLDHRVGRFDHADQPARLDHAQRIANLRRRRLRSPSWRFCHSSDPYSRLPRTYVIRPRAAIGSGSSTRLAVHDPAVIDQVRDHAGVIGHDPHAIAGLRAVVTAGDTHRGMFLREALDDQVVVWRGAPRQGEIAKDRAVAGQRREAARAVRGQRLAARVQNDAGRPPAWLTTVASTVSAQSSSVAAPRPTCVRSK